jgi:hypothetical protein
MMRAALEDVRARIAAILEKIDGALEADAAAAAPPPVQAAATAPSGLAWGAKVSADFRDKVRWIAEDLDIGPAPRKPEPNWLMACMAWETGRSFRPDVKNLAGSGATGLIQFMPSTARGLGTTVEALARKTAEHQLNEVWKYFEPFKGRLRSLSDTYMTILWPKGVGEPEDYALFTGGVAYRQNAGLDINKDGKVTKGEASAKVAAMLLEGLRPGNVA